MSRDIFETVFGNKENTLFTDLVLLITDPAYAEAASAGRPARRRYISKVVNNHSRFADMFIAGGH
jgi:hypothetical protein